ncbi:MAG: hypothetical protein M3077_05925 [Candidatus Dormibacteraeota bacterium]|nr:hypothetical protein [Candidatus Dormibacteraeota bacterium]
MEGAQGLRLRLVGSWTRVVITAAVVLVLWLAFAWLAATGRLADFRYLNVPILHPYPPAGYIQNPFNPADKGDLISVPEAARVKADLIRDGQLELRSAETGDVTFAQQSDTGKALDTLTALIQQNSSQGIVERVQNKFDSVVAGHLADPNDSHVVWAVKETGSATVSYLAKSDQHLLRQEAVRFENTFWLVLKGDHYLIIDALVQTKSQP